MAALFHAVISNVIRLSEGHKTLGALAVLRKRLQDIHCMDSMGERWAIQSSHDVKQGQC